MNSVSILTDLVSRRRVVFDLALRDYQQQYQGTYLGFLWMFFQPLLFIAVLYSVFTFGFRAQATVDMPFSLYLISGMICWMFFSSNFSSTAGVIKAYSFLVKKVDFRLSLLPAVKILSALPAHVFLIVIAVFLAWWQDFGPSWFLLQLLYYLFAMSMLLIGIGWITSSTSIFVKDVSNVVAVVTQFGFWLTPIFWNIGMIPERFRWIIELNPVFYLVRGYRDSIIAQVPFWERGDDTVYFWAVTLTLLLIGSRVYRGLRPHFAEVI